MEEKDNLKAFIDQHRNEFEDKNLPGGIWDNISRKLPAPQRQPLMVPLKMVLLIAAGFAVILAIGVAFFFNVDTNKSELATVQDESPEIGKSPDVFEMAPELAEAAFYYQTKISEVTIELSEYEIGEDDFESLRMLEDDLDMLKNEMGAQVDNEQLIEAMMRNYQYRLATLEQMLKDVKNTKEEDDKIEVNAVVPI